MDRFTEFDVDGRRYNDIRVTMGLNFFTVSWTPPLTGYPGWNLNLTAGAALRETAPAGSYKMTSCTNYAAYAGSGGGETGGQRFHAEQ